MRVLVLALILPSLVSCATITTGAHEQIKVSTSPSAANAALVCEGKLIEEASTPHTFTIRRNAGDCKLTLRKEGFAEQSIVIEQGVNPAYWGNMLFSPVPPAGVYVTALGDSGEKVVGVGLIGAGLAIFGTDFWTGAVHAHKPSTVDVVLKPK